MKDFVENLIVEVPDWPINGVNFKDITPVVGNPAALRDIIINIQRFCEDHDVTDIASPDARGWLFAAPLSVRSQLPMHLIRKPGKLPPPVNTINYEYEYASGSIEVKPVDLTGKTVCIVDDVNATGGTASATVDLLKEMGAEKILYACFIDLTFLGGTEKLQQEGVAVYSYLKYE